MKVLVQMIVWILLLLTLPTLCPRNVEGTFGPSGLIRSLAPAKYFIAFLLTKFISSEFFWKSEEFGQKTFVVEIVLLWGFGVNAEGFTVNS